MDLTHVNSRQQQIGFALYKSQRMSASREPSFHLSSGGVVSVVAQRDLDLGAKLASPFLSALTCCDRPRLSDVSFVLVQEEAGHLLVR